MSPTPSSHNDDQAPSTLLERYEPAKSKESTIGERPSCFKSTLHEISFVFMATIAMATNTFLNGATVIVTASIGEDLGMSQSQISWISAANTLAAGAFQLALGQLADLLGRKVIFLTGIFSFSAGCLIVAFARDPFWMDILCGVLGLSSAAVVPPAIGILGAAYAVPCKRKNWAFACFSSGNPLGFALGSVVCGIASRIFDWRAAFIFLAILWTIFGIASIWVIPSVEAFEPAPFWTRCKLAMKRFDSLGTLLTILGVGMVTASLTLGPSDGWKSAHVIAMLVIGFFLIVAFVYWESYWPDPLMPLHVWRDGTFSLLIIIANLGTMAFVSSNFWLAYSLQRVWNYSALEVAVRMLPQVIAGILWNIVAANIMHRINNSIIMAVGSLAFVTGSLLLSLQSEHSSYWAFMFTSLVITVIGADFQFNVTNMYVMQSLPSHQQGIAGGLFNTCIRLSSTIAIGISTAVFSSVEKAQYTDGGGSIMTPYKRAFDVGIGLAGFACLFVPFLRLGTQGGPRRQEEKSAVEDMTASMGVVAGQVEPPVEEKSGMSRVQASDRA